MAKTDDKQLIAIKKTNIIEKINARINIDQSNKMKKPTNIYV